MVTLDLEEIHAELGIPKNFAVGRKLKKYDEALLIDLVVAEIDFIGRPLCLTKETAKAWKKLVNSASEDEVILKPFSGFRSYLYQKKLISDRLASGGEINEILENVAAPGFSEHHTGKAIDITTDECEPLTEGFEKTRAFSWLENNAGQFGFSLSFPRGNPEEYIYEPWHWCFK